MEETTMVSDVASQMQDLMDAISMPSVLEGAFQNMPWLALLLALVAAYIFSMLWYSLLFGKQWMKLSGMTEEKAKEGSVVKSMLLEVVNTVVCLLGVYLMMSLAKVVTIGETLGLMGILWLGIAVPMTFSTDLWERRPWGLFAINIFRYLGQLMIMAAILFYVV